MRSTINKIGSFHQIGLFLRLNKRFGENVNNVMAIYSTSAEIASGLRKRQFPCVLHALFFTDIKNIVENDVV